MKLARRWFYVLFICLAGEIRGALGILFLSIMAQTVFVLGLEVCLLLFEAQKSLWWRFAVASASLWAAGKQTASFKPTGNLRIFISEGVRMWRWGWGASQEVLQLLWLSGRTVFRSDEVWIKASVRRVCINTLCSRQSLLRAVRHPLQNQNAPFVSGERRKWNA